MNQDTIEALLRAPLHKFTPEDWPDWYRRTADLLEHEDAPVRAAAVERLSMAAFWAEHRLPQGGRATDDAMRRRAVWLTDLVERASRRHPDVARFFLDELRYKGDDAPFPEILLPWLHGLRDRKPEGVPADRIEGAIVLIGGIAPWDGSDLPPILDHPSDYVRACAAHRLDSTDDEDGLCSARFLAALTAKELARPGIAGPYWSAAGIMQSEFGELGFDPVDWMLGIIERRSGPEPKGLPFNGIDFHIHELAAGDPEAIRRLIAAGRIDLAVMAATEIRDAVAGMTPLLSELADHPDSGVAIAAQIHLARYHGVLHPRAAPARIRHLPDWREDVEVFVVRYGEPSRFHPQAAIFPRGGAALDDARAWSLIDEALPPAARGDLARNPMDSHDAAPAPYQLGRDQLRSYVSGANVRLIGAPDGPGWRRIELSPGRLKTGGEIWDWSEHSGAL